MPKRGAGKAMHGNCSCTMVGAEVDVARVFHEGEKFVRTPEIIVRLTLLNPNRYDVGGCYGKAITPQRLGRYLAQEVGIRARKASDDSRGYCAADFELANQSTT